jgi:hypothetical protein
MENAMKLDDDARSKLVTVTYLRGLKFVSAEVHLDEEIVMSAARGEERADIEIKKINYWLNQSVA